MIHRLYLYIPMQASTSATIQTPSSQIRHTTPSHHAMALSSFKFPRPPSIPKHPKKTPQSSTMAKLLSTLALLALTLFLAVDASILRTTVSEIEDSGSCRIKMLTPCMNWVRQSAMADDEDWDVMNRSTGRGSQQYKKECCRMMDGMDMDCMCSSLKQTFRDKCSSRQSFRGQGGEMCGQMMTQKMMNLPKMCGFSDRSCSYATVLV